MTLFNIGPFEFIAILVIMFILIGPEGMVKTSRQMGVWIRQIVRSPIWREIVGYSQEIRELPTKLVRESGLDEDLAEIKKITTEATDEIQGTLKDANSEISQSLEETGNLEVKMDARDGSMSTSTTYPPPIQSNTTNTDGGEVSSQTQTGPVSTTATVEPPKQPIIID